jgi:tRNA-2-methylthio-N6-dimethylallyladenosine synthase
VKGLLAEGYKEITLLGQNVNSYGCDGNTGMTFAELLDAVASLDGEFRLRFMTSHPKDVSDELISVMKQYCPKIAPYFHLPLQSGSNRILKYMNRTYDREKYLSRVAALREAIPDICLSTDVIIGFPTESEEDFCDTLDILKQVKFDMVYSFKYSPREGTPAARMDGIVDVTVQEERMARLLAMQDVISLEKNKTYVGKEMRVLVDSLSRRREMKTVSARTIGNKLVHFDGDEAMIGQFKTVKIESAGAFELYATEIK